MSIAEWFRSKAWLAAETTRLHVELGAANEKLAKAEERASNFYAAFELEASRADRLEKHFRFALTDASRLRDKVGDANTKLGITVARAEELESTLAKLRELHEAENAAVDAQHEHELSMKDKEIAELQLKLDRLQLIHATGRPNLAEYDGLGD